MLEDLAWMSVTHQVAPRHRSPHLMKVLGTWNHTRKEVIIQLKNTRERSHPRVLNFLDGHALLVYTKHPWSSLFSWQQLFFTLFFGIQTYLRRLAQHSREPPQLQLSTWRTRVLSSYRITTSCSCALSDHLYRCLYCHVPGENKGRIARRRKDRSRLRS